MQKYKRLIIFVNLIIVIGLFTKSIVQKENILKKGKLILLELAPVDPRSLIQGDYMDLRYKLAGEVPYENLKKRGFFLVSIDSENVGKSIRIADGNSKIEANEYRVRYNVGNHRIRIGAESYFFQEGDADKYAKAKYGGLRVDSKGHSVLEGLYDKERARINP